MSGLRLRSLFFLRRCRGFRFAPGLSQCPIALENVKRTMEALPETKRGQVRALLISLLNSMRD